MMKNQCTHCMACIGNCPVEAIEYGTVTQKKPHCFTRKSSEVFYKGLSRELGTYEYSLFTVK